MTLELSESDKHLLNTPFKDLTSAQRGEAFALSDRIADYNRKQPSSPSNKTTIVMRDRLLENGVVSPLDGKSVFHNRKDWADHLKRNGCVEIGNDFNKVTEKKREIKGDFDCRNELGKATYQVMDKYGH